MAYVNLLTFQQSKLLYSLSVGLVMLSLLEGRGIEMKEEIRGREDVGIGKGRRKKQCV